MQSLVGETGQHDAYYNEAIQTIDLASLSTCRSRLPDLFSPCRAEMKMNGQQVPDSMIQEYLQYGELPVTDLDKTPLPKFVQDQMAESYDIQSSGKKLGMFGQMYQAQQLNSIAASVNAHDFGDFVKSILNPTSLEKQTEVAVGQAGATLNDPNDAGSQCGRRGNGSWI